MTIDERIQALTMTLELAVRQLEDHRKLIEIDGENIRSLARIAEAHEKRLDRIEG